MKKIYPYLTYAGAIPFVLCVAFLVFNIKELPFIGTIDSILSVYALVISSFLSGSLWGGHLQSRGVLSIYLPVLSNILAIFLWFGFLLLDFKNLIFLFIFAFIILLIVDYYLFKNKLITHHYFRTRCLVTIIVVISLMISRTFYN